MIERRSVLLALAAAAALPRHAWAQAPGKVRRIGILNPGPPLPEAAPFMTGLVRHLSDRGYVVGTDLVIDRRDAEGKIDRLPQLVAELVAMPVNVIVTISYPAALAAKEHSAVPVVVTSTGDPVATGLVASLARPGGNLTGVTEIAPELSAKRLELLKETMPTLHQVAMLWNADDLGMTLRYQAADAAAQKLGVAVQPLGVREPNDFEAAFAAMTSDPPDGILMVTDVLTILNRKRVFEFAAARKLPAIYEYDNLVHDGGLMSYGPDRDETVDSVAGLVDRILKGAKPAELPMELPTRYKLAVNLKTAQSIGLTVPKSILVRADDVIE